jgi:hypothetical protein
MGYSQRIHVSQQARTDWAAARLHSWFTRHVRIGWLQKYLLQAGRGGERTNLIPLPNPFRSCRPQQPKVDAA